MAASDPRRVLERASSTPTFRSRGSQKVSNLRSCGRASVWNSRVPLPLDETPSPSKGAKRRAGSQANKCTDMFSLTWMREKSREEKKRARAKAQQEKDQFRSRSTTDLSEFLQRTEERIAAYSTASTPKVLVEQPRRGSDPDLGSFQARTKERLEMHREQMEALAAQKLQRTLMMKRGLDLDVEAFHAETMIRVADRTQALEAEATQELRAQLEDDKRRWEELAALLPDAITTTKATPIAARLGHLEPLAWTSTTESSVIEFDGILTAAGVSVLAVGDCHASRSVCLLTSHYDAQFFGGAIFSWISGKRKVPPLHSLYSGASRFLVLLLSYGAIDCRCHSSKWAGNPESLSEPYVEKVSDYITEFNRCVPRVRVIPIVLAVPPTTEQVNNLIAPCRDTLALRIQATALLNSSLESVCAKFHMAHTGADTWDFAKDAGGALRSDLSDGHGHVLSKHCGPVHERLRRLIQDAIKS